MSGHKRKKQKGCRQIMQLDPSRIVHFTVAEIGRNVTHRHRKQCLAGNNVIILYI